MQFGVIRTCTFFKDYKIALALRACAILISLKKLTRAYLHQIALEIMLLPILNLT